MKAKKTELDVDFIGGQEPLTAEEEKALSDFFKSSKLTSIKTTESKKTVTGKRAFKQLPGH